MKDFSDLRAIYINCTLKKSPELSHTEGLMELSMAIMRKQGVAVDYLRQLTSNSCLAYIPT